MKYLREIQPGERVRVYYNLHRSVWSVQNTKGQVIAHMPELSLTNVQWVVRPAGRAKVLREKKKNVHAFGVGNFSSNEGARIEELQVPRIGRARYNPFKAGHFTTEDGKPLSQSAAAFFNPDRNVYQWDGV